MNKQETMKIHEEKIHQLKNMAVAFTEEEFLLIFNASNKEEDGVDGEYMVSIPAEVMAKIVEGLYSSGLKYQDNFGKSIGFSEKEA